MNRKLLGNVIAGSYALALHIIIVFMLLVSFDSVPTRVAVPKNIDIVQATIINEQQILDGIRQRQEHLEEKARLEKKVLDRKKEKLQIQQQKRREAIAQENKRFEKQKRELKAKLKAKEKKKKKQANKAKQLKAEKKKKAAEDRENLVESKRKKQAEEKAKIAEAQRITQESISKKNREKEKRKISLVVNKYMGMIGQRIKRYWIEPANAEQGMETVLRVILLPSGDVNKVSIIKSSGNDNFDRSARTAVYKAAPWPQPREPKAALVLRDFKFVFRPH